MRRHWFAILLAAAAVVLAVRWLAFEPFEVSSASMEPTLGAGDHVVANKLAYRFDAPQRGDLAVLHHPRSDEVLVKRIVAVGGDSVGLEDGVLVVNGHAQREPFADPELIDSIYFGPVRVPPGRVFVMGDQRANSEDSRDFGAVALDAVIGRADTRFWPPGALARG